MTPLLFLLALALMPARTAVEKSQVKATAIAFRVATGLCLKHRHHAASCVCTVPSLEDFGTRCMTRASDLLTDAICTVTTKDLSEPALSGRASREWSRRHRAPHTYNATRQSIHTYSDLPLVARAAAIGTHHRYQAPGTASVSMSYPG
ncbi:hypothetical protein [Roseobacter sp.]|uniref:hypothetical protein n=1 Tax=Roseobacter sp. TaxID=1907202 RepID=UPI00385AB65E